MPEEIRVARHGGTPWAQTIYQTRKLTAANGYIPQRVVARQLSAALDGLGIDHVIRFGFRAFDAPTEDTGCGNDAAIEPWMDFLENEAPVVSMDSNLLITNADGGGCGVVDNTEVRGNAGVGPGGNIDTDPGAFIEMEASRWGSNVSACLHEVGHNMGFVHDPHPGWADNIGSAWHRTPTNSAAGINNLCGVAIPPRNKSSVVNHLYYNGCVAEHLLIENKKPLDLTSNDLGLGCEGVRVVGRETVAAGAPTAVEVDVRLGNGTSTDVVVGYTVDIGPLSFGPFDEVVPTDETVTETVRVNVAAGQLDVGEYGVGITGTSTGQTVGCGTVTVEAGGDTTPSIGTPTLALGGIAMAAFFLARPSGPERAEG